MLLEHHNYWYPSRKIAKKQVLQYSFFFRNLILIILIINNINETTEQIASNSYSGVPEVFNIVIIHEITWEILGEINGGNPKGFPGGIILIIWNKP